MRILAVFAASFAAGIFLSQYLLPIDWLLPCAVVCFALACGRLFLRKDTGRRLLLAGLGLSLAFGWNWLYVRQVQRPAEAVAESEQSVIMTLTDYAVATDYGAKVTVTVEGLPGKIVYYGEETLLELAPGQRVEDLVYFQSAARIRDDDITTFTSKGIFLLAYNRGIPEYGMGEKNSVRWYPARLCRAMQENIAALFEGDDAGFLTAILTGDKTGLSEEAAADLSEAGLYHILAVSGMHCGFLLVLVGLLTGRHRRRLMALCAIPVLVFYGALTGGSPSVLRACIMLSFLLAAPVFGRENDGPTALSTALFLILLKNPFAAASASLQLSFAAMAGILWLTPKLYLWLINGRKHGKVFHFIAAGFSATMGALVFTVPLSGYYFGILALISPLSNLLCLTAASGVFVLGLVTVMLSFISPPLAGIFGMVPVALMRYILMASEWLAEIPYHAVYYTNPYLKFWVAYVYLLFGAAYVFGKKFRRTYYMAAGLAISILVLTICLGQARFRAGLDAVVLDVGQGQSVVLASDDTFALVDCGSGNSWYDAGTLAANQLATMGCRRLDYLILTHYDSDHVSGVVGLMARMEVGTLLVPEAADDLRAQLEILAAAQRYGVSVQAVTAQEKLAFGQGEVTVLPPVGEESDNERGLTILAGINGTELLVTGDMDRATERKLLAEYALPDIEYLLAGHHGSGKSTSEDLLDALMPETVCISVGSNSYGHPADELLWRLVERNYNVYRTDLHGNVHLRLN